MSDRSGRLPLKARPGAHARARRRPGARPSAGASWSRSTTRAACTGTCASSTTACWPPGRCPRESRRIRRRTGWRCAPRTTRSSTSSSTARSPTGNYGAGTMEIWDSGTYEAEKFRDDEVIVDAATASASQGRYALFQTEGKDWMIHRMDPPADPAAEPCPSTSSRCWPRSASSRATTAHTAYEVKWDGVRAVAHVDAGHLTLTGRNGTDFTPRYPEVRAMAGALGSRRLILDGEVVAFDARGPAELRAAPVAHAPGVGLGREAAHEGRAGGLRGLRPAVAGGPLDAGAALLRSPPAAGRARARRARAGAPPRTGRATAPRCWRPARRRASRGSWRSGWTPPTSPGGARPAGSRSRTAPRRTW